MAQVTTSSESVDPSQLLAYQNLINKNQAGYPGLAIPNYGGLMQTQSGNIASLLSPTNFSDQQRQGAEQAVGSGTEGSQFAANNTLNLTENERIRRQQIGSQMLNAATSSLPSPVNPASLLGRTSTSTTGVPGYATYNATPGGVGGPRAPLVSPGDAAPVGMYGRATAPAGGGSMDWLNQIINGYSPQTPAYQMNSGESPGSVNVGDPAFADLGIDPRSGLYNGGAPVQNDEFGAGPVYADEAWNDLGIDPNSGY